MQRNSVSTTKTIINGFILIALSISLFQELSRVSQQEQKAKVQSPDQAAGLNQTGLSTNETVVPLGQAIPNLVIKTTQKFDSEVKTLLSQEGYNVEVKSYEFQGEQWWFNAAIQYGHILVMYALMTKYKTQTNDGNKKKIMIFGAVLVFGWMFIGNMFKLQKVSIEFNQSEVYISDKVDRAEIVGKIAQFQELDEFTGF